MKKLVFILIACSLSLMTQAQLTEHPNVDKQTNFVETEMVRVHLFGVEAIISIDAYRLATTWVSISPKTTLSYIDPQTKEEKEIPITSLQRIVGQDWVESTFGKSYRLRDFGGTVPHFRLFFSCDNKLPESLSQINIKENISRGFKFIGIHINPVNYHYRQDKNVGNQSVIDSLISRSNIACAGVYENTNEDFSCAIIENKGETCMVFYDGNASTLLNEGGDIIADLKGSASSNLFIGTLYNYADQTSERVKILFNDGIMTMIRENNSELTFVKTQSKDKRDIVPSTGKESGSPVKATGSGFFVSEKIVVTNNHVIENANDIKITLNINGIFEEFKAKVLSTDKTNDIALLTIKDENFNPLKPAPYSIIPNTVDVGTAIFTIGYPFSDFLGQEPKITDGLISSKTGFSNDAVTYQISAPIQPGNSGCPLFDKKGHVVGIVNAGIPAADNVGYAIKSAYLLNLIDSAPIDISLPKGENMQDKDLPEMVKAYTPYIVLIKIY